MPYHSRWIPQSLFNSPQVQILYQVCLSLTILSGPPEMEAEARSNAPESNQRVMLESVSMHTFHALSILSR